MKMIRIRVWRAYLAEPLLFPFHLCGDILGDGEGPLKVGRPVHAVLDQGGDGCGGENKYTK